MTGPGFPDVDYATWRVAVERDLGGADFDRRLVVDCEGLRIGPLYAEGDASARAGRPRRGGVWTIANTYAEADPDELNRRLLADFDGGASGARIDVPAMDADGWDAVLRDVLADAVEVVVADGSPEAGAGLLAAARRRTGASRWHCGVDPLRGGGELASAVAADLPEGSCWRVSTARWHGAGADAPQCLGAALAGGIHALRVAEEAGLDAAAAQRLVVFDWALDADQFLGIAALRALRATWNRILELAGVDADARRIRIHAHLGDRVLTRRDPWVNVLRGTVATFAGAVGGADLVVVPRFDLLAGTMPGVDSARLARNTQLVLAEESHLARVDDPGGGSWYVERLTEDLCAAGWARMRAIEAAGGLLALGAGSRFAAEVADAAARRATLIARRKRAITGVSEFPDPDEAPPRSDPPDAGNGAFPLRRDAAPWEALRDRGDAAGHARPAIFLAVVGSLARATPRLDFCRNLLVAGGLRPVPGPADVDDAAIAAACAASGATVAICCGDDRDYAARLSALAPALRAAGVAHLAVAGRPGEHEDAWRAAGVDGFVALGDDVLAFLAGCWEGSG